MAMLTVMLSSMNNDVVQAIVLQDALPSSEIPIQSKKEVRSIFLIFRFITGPTELGDVPTPRTPPKIFVNTDSEQEELILVVYKVLLKKTKLLYMYLL